MNARDLTGADVARVWARVNDLLGWGRGFRRPLSDDELQLSIGVMRSQLDPVPTQELDVAACYLWWLASYYRDIGARHDELRTVQMRNVVDAVCDSRPRLSRRPARDWVRQVADYVIREYGNAAGRAFAGSQ